MVSNYDVCVINYQIKTPIFFGVGEIESQISYLTMIMRELID